MGLFQILPFAVFPHPLARPAPRAFAGFCPRRGTARILPGRGIFPLFRKVLFAGFERTSLPVLAESGIAGFAFGSFALRRRQLVENRGIAFGNPDAGDFFDGAQVAFLVGSAEGNRDAVLSRAGRASNPMYERFGDVGKVVIENMRNVVDVDAPGGDVRCDQNPNLFRFEISQGFLSAVLAFVAVNRRAFDARFFEHPDDFVRAVLCPRKDENLFHFGMFEEHFLEKRALSPFVDAVEFLSDAFDGRALRGDFDADGIRAQNRCGELRDFGRHRGAEKEVLPVRREKRDDFPNVVDESHVEHSVRFVEYKVLQLLEAYDALRDEVEKTSRSRYQNVDALGKRAFLGNVADASENARTRDGRVFFVHFETFENLDGEFPGRKQHEDADGLLSFPCAVAENVLENGKGERGGFAGSRLRDSHQVLSFENGRNRFFLYRCGCRVSRVVDCAKQAFVQGKF